MPIRTITDRSRELTEYIVTGDVTDKEMFACQKEFYEAGPTRLELWDMSDSDLSQITTTGMNKFIRRASRLGKSRYNGRTAVIAPSVLQYGLGRMAEAFGEFESLPFAFRVFRKREDAVRWLKEADS